jgi:hypothetical protein
MGQADEIVMISCEARSLLVGVLDERRKGGTDARNARRLRDQPSRCLLRSVSCHANSATTTRCVRQMVVIAPSSLQTH